MTAPRYITPYGYAYNSVGQPISGALLNFYLQGSSTRATTYADPNLATPNTNPVVADANGTFPNIFLDPAITYKAVLTYPVAVGATVIWTADPLNAPIGGSSGAGQIGFSQTATYPAKTVGYDLQGFVNVKSDPFNAAGDGVTDDTAAFNAALTYVGATGGTLWVPQGVYVISSTLTIPQSTAVIGVGWFSGSYGSITAAASVIKYTGTGAAFIFPRLTANQIVRNLGFFGNAGAHSAIQVGSGLATDADQNGSSEISNVSVTGFGSAGGGAVYLASCQRCTIDKFLMINNYTGIKVGPNCGARLHNGNVAVTSINGKAFDATSGGAGGVSIVIDEVYFESCPGQYPIDISNSGDYWFNGGGVEAMCYADPTTVTNPAIFRIQSNAHVHLNMRTIDYLSSGDNLAGTLSLIEMGSDLLNIELNMWEVTSNYAGAGRAGATYKWLRQLGYYTVIQINYSRMYAPAGGAINTLFAALKAYAPQGGMGFTPKNLSTDSYTIGQAGNLYTDYRRPHPIVVPIVLSGGGTTAPYPLVQTGTGSTTYNLPVGTGGNVLFPSGWFSGGSDLVFEIVGSRAPSGAPGNMSAQFKITSGATIVTVPISDLVATNAAFRARVQLKYDALLQQELSVTWWDGTTSSFSTQTLSLNNNTDSIGFSVVGTCVNAADVLTIKSIIMDRH